MVRLSVESQEYENKLKNATASLQHMEKEVRRVGGTFAVADKEDLEFIESLGSMETKATNARGKINEMTQSIAEMTLVFQRMSEEEKKSATGQALSAAIEQQKGNLQSFKDALSDASGEVQKSSGFLDTLTDGLSQLGPVGQMAGKLLKGAFGPVGIAIAAVVGVIHQVVEAFRRNEDAMASAERAAAPFKAMWQGIQRIFDKLVPLIADAIEGISNGIQKMFGKLTDWMGRISQTSLGKKLGLDTVYEQLKQIQQAQNDLTASNEKIANSERELKELRRTTKTANTSRSAQISELRYKASDKEAYSADERVGFLDKAMELEKRTLQANIALRQKEYELIKLKNSLTQSGTADLDAENDALNAVTEAQIAYNESVRSMQRQRQAAVNEVQKEAKAAASGSSEPTALNPTMAGPSMSAFEKLQQSVRIKLADQNFDVDQSSLTNLMTVAIQNGITGMDGAFEGLQYQLAEGMNIPDSAWEELAAQINEKLAELNLDPIELDVDTGNIKTLGKEVEDQAKGVGEGWKSVASAVNTVGGALQQIEDPGAKIAGIIAQAVANVALSFAEAAASPAVTSTGWGWLGFAAAGIATMIGTIASIKSVTAGSYASGGIIPGNSYSGDNLTANVNSGELILNRAQQGSIASQLTNSNPLGNLRLSTEISGTNLRIVMNNDNRSKGGSRGYYANIH